MSLIMKSCERLVLFAPRIGLKRNNINFKTVFNVAEQKKINEAMAYLTEWPAVQDISGAPEHSAKLKGSIC